jgi:putative membrane protein
LYAWINIYACWDPYSNTGNLPVAIVNKDQGTVFNGKVINAGNSMIEQLKENKSIGWDFVDEWQGNYGLNMGRYYALIEIPDNFSARLVTLTTTNPQKPAIVYRVNEKLNSIATKITDAAKNKLVSTMTENFVKTVNNEGIISLNEKLKDTNLKPSQVDELKRIFAETNSDITKLKGYIKDTNTDSKDFQLYLNKCTETLPKLNERINSMQSIISSNKSLIQKTRQTVEAVSSDLNTDVVQLNSLNNMNQMMISELKQLNDNTSNKNIIGIMEQSSSICYTLDIMLKADAEQIRSLNKSYNLNALSLLADSVLHMDQLVLSEKSALDKQIPILKSDFSKNSVSASLDALSGLSSEITKETQDISNSIQMDWAPLLNGLVDDMTIELDDASSVAELGRVMVPQLSALSVFGGASSQFSISQANKLDVILTDLQGKLKQLISKLDKITTKDVKKLFDIIQKHPAEIADFISSPIEVKEIEVYNTGIFGVGLTPFYTVLAIWVGALLNCALLTVEFEKDTIRGRKLNLKQKHFGKMMLFLLLSLIQSTIVTLGDVFVLGVKPADFKLMLCFSALTSVTFTVIIFTLVSLFGNVGKAIAVIMMVFQIAGAGGIYPIQTNPEVFGRLEPLWPFTYAINCFREAIAGPVWNSVKVNVMALLVFLAVFLILAVLKKPFHSINKKMHHIYEQAKI